MTVSGTQGVVQHLYGMKNTVGGTDIAQYLMHGQFRLQMVLDIAVAHRVGIGLPKLFFLLQLAQCLAIVAYFKQIGYLAGIRCFVIIRGTQVQVLPVRLVLFTVYGIKIGSNRIAACPAHSRLPGA